MNIVVLGHNYNYELEKLTRLFFPFEKITFLQTEKEITEDFYAITKVETQNSDAFIYVELVSKGNIIEKSQTFVPGNSGDFNINKEIEHKLAGILFDAFYEMTGYKAQWGILTGIRPAKLYRKFTDFLGEDKADLFFKNEFKVSEKKLDLLKKTAISEDKIISKSKANSVSVYISIPFCPSRCNYCSFVSHSVEKAVSLIPEYFNYLLKEIDFISAQIKKLGLKVLTVYVGGGTPTTLSAQELSILTEKINNCFGQNLMEFTVEAGRPDTITKEKLLALYKGNVSRISINPQTLNDDVLNFIGRKHTALQTVEAFNLAREIGFKNINMDLIAGLPKDTFESFKNTLHKIIDLNPESVTVHTLSLKRSSGMGLSKDDSYLLASDTAAKMVEYAENLLSKNNILPYYMYRQSKTVGNLENVGYAKPGFEGLYNVYIMDETHTILACGASAVTKLKDCNTGNIERIFNYKYPYEYINNFDEMLSRKSAVEEFYDKYPFKNK